jgi:hypothetical protein
MFPVVRAKKDTLRHAIDYLEQVELQAQQIKLYCERLLV